MRIEGSCAGGWEQSWVRVDGNPLVPAHSLAIRNHSPTGFSWGYGGSGPSQLALAILLHAGYGNDADEQWHGGTAERLYQRFKDEFIAPLRDAEGPLDSFAIEVDIDAWVAAQGVGGPYRTKSGRILTDEDIEALSAEAEHGYDVEKLRNDRG